ncbi:hypothetical protein JSQ81_04845 [Sporosarcina sp. Marseille-Q4063]|uniref:hypothetical protein n=1 Tax=Sporosarcina sp. Marseille-Q4063 TaxID=2810514 RepID=UPI001BAFB048|nr:hypothetical protein [Sporosarcina sp. Marseille-Q4063]QUW22908.1 hypothetical protein JSQ81_04845 [Sporosarcina sp. Marseille-Q4063]
MRIILYNVTWNSSETKKIYQAAKNSEILMAYLERRLLENNLAELIGEAPSPKRGYGVLIYYYSNKPKKRLLSAAPRRNKDYIHVVIFNNKITKMELQKLGFETGNYKEPPDVKIGSKEDVDKLVEICKAINHTR